MESRELLTLLGQQLFPSDNPWNQNVAAAPVAANSSAVINNIISLYGNGRFHPDFSQDTGSSNPLYGIPFNVVHGNTQAKVRVVVGAYASESDVQNAPIPANAVLEGDNQNGPVSGLGNRGDSHLIVYDEDNNIAYEFYATSRPSENSDGQWHADQESVWNLNTNSFRTLGWTSADAAGLPILPGLLRPDEALPASQGGQGVINHAIRITLQNNTILDKFIYPASHVANSGTNAAVQVPMGTRLRLKSSVDISTLDPESQVIARAMQQYGVIVADNGGNFFATGAGYSVDAGNNRTLTWNDADIQDSVHGLKSLTFSDFEVVDLAPVVTGLSASTGSAGTTLTVNGSGFSGAAGHLQVLFGNTAATQVNVLSDSQVSVVVPSGSGTVDVRVQSGINTPDTQNINNPIFGYGASAVTTADRFNYGAPPANQAPTVATAASASPNPVNGSTTALSVLGADDAGEANLTYTWQATASPAGSNPSFSVNGTNAAKNTTVTFNQTGSYTFRVTIKDQGGLSTSSSVVVVVNPPAPPPNQAPTVATAAAANPNPVNGSTTTLSVLGADDAGEANLTYTWQATASPTGSHPVFSANGTNAAKTTTVSFDQSGSYTFQVTIKDQGGLSTSSSVVVTVNLPAPPSNQAPTVAQAAAAGPNPVNGLTTSLSVLGADDAGESNLTYTWKAITAPSGATPIFSANDTNGAKNTQVTFDRAGDYAFSVVIADSSGLSVTSTVNVTVNAVLSRIVVSPATATVANGAQQQFTASALDQFGKALTNQPSFTWSIASGSGSVSSTGLYTAPSSGQTVTVLQATADGLSGQATITAGRSRWRHWWHWG